MVPLQLVPVEAATAPSRIGGMPSVGTMKAAAKQVILAVAEEAADSVLWWKFCRPRFPRPCRWGRRRKTRRRRRNFNNQVKNSL